MTGAAARAGAASPRPADDIILVPSDRRIEAVRRLVPADGDDRANARRFLRFSREQGLDLRAMWARVDQRGAIDSVVLAVPSPGRTAMFFVTPPRDEAAIAPGAGLIERACRGLREGGSRLPDVTLGQALLKPTDVFETAAYLRAGFSRLAELAYLERPLGRPVEAPAWPARAEVTPYHPEHRDEVMAVLEASYRDTLDCPGLLGLRRTEDVFAGHLAAGEHDPDLWLRLHVDGRPAGVLLLTPVPASATIELVYLGLAPFARGRGLGRALLRHGLARLAGRRETRITLAVDERNAPALRLYRGEGFSAALRRTALIVPLAPA